MNRLIIGIIASVLAILPGPSAAARDEPAGNMAKVVVIPVRTEIGPPSLFLVRRGLKQAINSGADTVVLDMKTPGGRLDVTLEIMEALDRFPGTTVTYVNDEASSAGAIIASVSDEIHFSPKATIGAAEAVMGTGEDIGESMKRKLNSFMGSKIRALAGEDSLRAQVIRAMMEPDFEFKVGDTMIKAEGELLSLTAKEAMQTYGDPPQPLLGTSIAPSLDALLDDIHDGNPYKVEELELTWSESLAYQIKKVSALLIAIGMLGLFIEFKTPGFGVFGITGIAVLTIVLLSNQIAGLSGYEPILFLLLGVVLLALELFLFPGTMVAGLSGAVMILGALVWAMLDIWPDQPLGISGDALVGPLLNVTLGVVGAVVLFIGMLKYLPGGGLWGKMVLNAAVAGAPNGIRPVHSAGDDTADDSLVGQTGKAVTNLFPSGQVEVAGKRYEARLAVGFAEPGAEIVVTGITQFGLSVEVKPS